MKKEMEQTQTRETYSQQKLLWFTNYSNNSNKKFHFWLTANIPLLLNVDYYSVSYFI